MKRSGFKPKGWAPRPTKQIEYEPRARPVATAAGPSSALIKPAPKNPPGRSQAYRDAARDKPCMMRVPGVCNHDPSTTVLAHSNSGADGKGMGLKADDAIGAVWACSCCHQWLDQGNASAAQKEAAHEAAFERQVAAITEIAAHGRGREREAAQWALDRIRRARGLPSEPAAPGAH